MSQGRLRTEEDRLASLLEGTKRMAASTDAAALLPWIACEGARFLTAEGAGIRLLDGEGLVEAARYGYSPDGIGEPVPLAESPSGWVVRHNQPLAIEDIEDDARVIANHRAAYRREGFRSMLAVPVRIGEQAIGALYVFTRSLRRFSAAEIEILSGYADQAALAVDNLRLHEEAQRRARELRDAHEQLRAVQAQLAHAARLTVVGQLASGVVHDFKNVLAVIIGRTQILRSHGPDPDLERQLHVIEQAASDAAATALRIEDFVRTRPLRPYVPVDLAALLAEVSEFTQPRWQNEASAAGILYEVRVTVGPVPLIEGDPAELREVFTNLVLNALEAMPKGGRLDLTAAPAGDRVQVTVRDTGSGMSESVRQRAFEPFFTTKGASGTGLGLSVALGLVQRHGGTITIDTEPDKGTAFILKFPVLVR